MTGSIARKRAADRVAIVTNTPPGTYSGGRYHALMLAEALAMGGHDVHFVTDFEPIFLKDLAALPAHDRVHINYTPDFRRGLPKGDFSFILVVPGTNQQSFYRRATRFAFSRHARLGLINFESGNWFNAVCPFPRDLLHWALWRAVARHCSLILSISGEGDRWARDFYTDVQPGARFDYAYPAINTVAADATPDVPREKRILLFARFAQAAHKGGNHLNDLLCEAMRDHTLVLIAGAETPPEAVLAPLRARAESLGVTIEIQTRLCDREKFAEMKRARLMLFPSLFEGYGYPPMEAQYCLTPCVAFDLPVLRETSGDRLCYAAHGDWDDFRAKTEMALGMDTPPPGLRENARQLASPEALAERMNAVLDAAVAAPAVEGVKRSLRIAALVGADAAAPFLGLAKWAVRGVRRRLFPYLSPNALLGGARWMGRLPRRGLSFFRHHVLARPARKPGRYQGVFCYHPAFDSAEELTSHYHRACWYLPRVAKACEHVYLFHNLPDASAVPGARPAHMAPSPSPVEHITVSRGRWAHLRRLLRCRVILVWKSRPRDRWILALCRLLGARVANVATNDPEAKEYGEYARLIWRHGFTIHQQQEMLSRGRSVFERAAAEVRAVGYPRAAVFGTGPSLETATDFDFAECLTIVCNSIVQNDALLNHLRPRFLCAGDVVSHLGVSAYAAKFREDLLRAVAKHDLYFVTTASFGALLLFHHPELNDRTILIDQRHKGPNYDFGETFSAPMLDSTLNIHMLPLAATFADEIWVLGCDGKSETRDNEDFWAHAQKAQYDELVDSGHQCHPTFDINRQKSTYQRFLDSVEETVTIGEARHGKAYGSLQPSNIPTLKPRALSPEHLAEAGFTPPYPVRALAALLPKRDGGDEMRVKSTNTQ